MEGFIAVAGFWTFMLAIVLRRPLSEVISKSRVNNEEVTMLKAQVQQLQNSLDAVNREMFELKETNEFTQKLLNDRSSTLKIGTDRITTSNR
jgi:BMFP domain-containing protein YqiC